jgi:cytochrome oxidase Cu insertion factor (SCO1/SenC/PrrC family)
VKLPEPLFVQFSVFRKFRIPLIVAAVLLVVAVLFVAAQMRLPKPQGSFTAGQLAPDFTLNDQDGHPFPLSDQRGAGVLLIFYRGYW